MPLFTLEKFDPAQDNDRDLEDLKAEVLSRERDEAYARGFKDGVSVTRDAIEAEQNRLISQLSESLDDRRFERLEINRIVLKSLKPLIEAVINKVAPDILMQEHVPTILRHLTEIAETHIHEDIVVECDAETAEAIRPLVEDRNMPVSFSVRQDLNPGSAHFVWGDGVDELNADAVLESLRQAATDYFSTVEELSDERSDRTA